MSPEPKPGPYMYLPLIGPTTVRDLAGRLGDISFLPLTVGKPFNELAFTVPTTTIRLIDERAEADGEIRTLLDSNSDPYAAIRDTYLQKRQVEIDELRHARTCRQSPGPHRPVLEPVEGFHAVTDANGRPDSFLMTAGKVSDYISAAAPLDEFSKTQWLLADGGYDADWFRDALQEKASTPCIPGRKSRTRPSTP